MRVLLLLGSLASVAARSAGLVATADTYGCNPLVGKWGCTNFTPDPTDGHRAGCSDPGLPSQFSGTVMWWTGKPKVSSNYTLRTADGVPASDPTTYIPGERMTLYLRVLAPRAQYRGLLLYAVNVNETKVGDWILPFEDDPQFGRFNNIICPKSVMHVTADEKAYLEAFTFVAPPSGTGRITFRALVKTGSPNPTFSGDFLWPVKNLTLTEAVGAPPSQWSVLPAGVNCNTYCQNQSLVCTPASLGNLGTEMAAAVQRVFPCHPAVFSSCNSGPSADTTGGTNFCTFHDTQAQCTTDARTYTAPSCTAVSSALKPLFCFCGQYVPPPTVPPTVAVVPTNAPAPTTVGTPTTAPAPTVPGSTGSPTVVGAPTTPQAPTTAQIAAAGKTSASLFGLLIGAFALVATSQSRASFGVMFVLCIAMTANAHNYIEGTRGRAPTANTIQPTFPQIAREEIHMQVLAGQEFMIEWAAAHNDDTYIVILAAEDEAMLRRHNRTSLTDYLNNAPTNATAAALDPKWAKYHRVAYNVDIKTNQTMGTSIAANAIFQDIIPRESPYYLGDRPAPPIFPARFCTGSGPGFNMSIASGKFCNESLQFSHKLSAQAKDARASYVSAKYPWIEAVMRFSNQGFVHGVAATRITIPARKGAGRYIIHYLWSSYRDNWDVDVKTTGGAVVNPYGTLSNYTPYTRADHCVFQDARGFGSSCLQVFDSYNTSQCKAACDSDGSCKGYGVVPLGGGPLFPSYSPIPWGAPGSTCDKALFAGLPADTKVCYTVTSFVDNAAGSVPPWTFFTDTLDVGFYSTCYIKLDAKNWDRPVAAPPASEPVPYRFKDRCIPCSHRFQNNMLQVPSWEVSRSCVDCDAEPDTLPPRAAVPAWTGPEQTNKFFSYTNCTTSPCFKWLAPAGSAYAFEEECRILAKSTTACSKYVAFSRLRPRSTTVVNKRGKWTPADLNVTLSSTGLRYHTCACWTDKVRAPVYVNTTAAFSQVIGTTTGDFAIWQMN